jgi:phospholipid/cholesterol/gamma-HCH transport system substrate-binding protein
MSSPKLEIIVGVFVATGIAAFFMLAINISNMGSYRGAESYQLQARFGNIGGLKVRSPVSAAGVVIGRVTDIQYNMETFEAVVSLSIDNQYNRFPVDSAASVMTSGLLGEQFISLEPGADITFLKDGDVIEITQSAVMFEQLIGEFIYNQKSEE